MARLQHSRPKCPLEARIVGDEHRLPCDPGHERSRARLTRKPDRYRPIVHGPAGAPDIGRRIFGINENADLSQVGGAPGFQIDVDFHLNSPVGAPAFRPERKRA